MEELQPNCLLSMVDSSICPWEDSRTLLPVVTLRNRDIIQAVETGRI